MTAKRKAVFALGTASCLLFLLTPVRSQNSPAGPMSIWAQRHYQTSDNPLQTELRINEKTINIYTSDTFEPVAGDLKPGWNVISLKTTPQSPSAKQNGLLFRIGPMHKDERDNKMVMAPVLWSFNNFTDWEFKDGRFLHPLGPDVKEVTLSFRIYYAGLDREQQELKAGDYVLRGKPRYASSNAPVTATVWVNGTPLNTFTLEPREVVITSLLKPGKNEIRLVSSRVQNSIKANDIEFDVAGPAEWNVPRKGYVVTPLLQFGSMQGWSTDPRTGKLVNSEKPDSDTLERVIPFILKEEIK
jgi:hypothetical protein